MHRNVEDVEYLEDMEFVKYYKMADLKRRICVERLPQGILKCILNIEYTFFNNYDRIIVEEQCHYAFYNIIGLCLLQH